MHREDILALSRAASQQHAEGKNSVTMASTSSSDLPKRKHFVFTDPVAFRYLEEDPATVVIERHGVLEGYELYIVEQWACSRVHPTFVITSYTGDKNHTVSVGVLDVPADEEAWSPRLRVYFKAISQHHARRQETSLGILMITNLNSFPSTLTVIPVPDGDVNRHREDFLVNENLKRLGCSGRSGMSLATPAGATQAKFHQLYKTSDQIPLYAAVIEVVKLCQVALVIFGKLEQEYSDGCLCDITEKAIEEWWTEIGSEHYNTEPTDGILGPTTVAALLGMLMGARNRLSYCGAPVGKDAFDIYVLKRGIAQFQKSQKLERTRELDRHTLDRLHKVTAEAAAGEGWAVPKAVRSTVVELSGKSGQMVMGMVGRDKAGIADIETLDIDNFINLVYGERAKWLWYGKPRRSGATDQYGRSNDTHNLTFSKDDQAGYVWSNNRSEPLSPEEQSEARRKDKESPGAVYSLQPPGSAVFIPESPGDKDHLHKTVFKSVTGKMSDARSGFGRIKDAVGLRGHTTKQSKDEGMGNGLSSPTSSIVGQPTGPPGSPRLTAKTFTWKETPTRCQNGTPKIKELPSRPASRGVLHGEYSHSEHQASVPTVALPDEDRHSEPEERWHEQAREIRREVLLNTPSIAGSYNEGDLKARVVEAKRDASNFELLMRRRNSISGGVDTLRRPRNGDWWPRQMSFSEAEDALFDWEPIESLNDGEEATNCLTQKRIDEDFRHIYEKITQLQDAIIPWVETKLQSVGRIEQQFALDQESFQSLYMQLMEQYQILKQSSQDVLGRERSQIGDAIKDIDVLGAKLEYEINTLVSKVQDVEDGVNQFERQVVDLESRADELETQLNMETWTHWIVRSLMGIGTGPQVTGP